MSDQQHYINTRIELFLMEVNLGLEPETSQWLSLTQPPNYSTGFNSQSFPIVQNSSLTQISFRSGC